MAQFEIHFSYILNGDAVINIIFVDFFLFFFFAKKRVENHNKTKAMKIKIYKL